MAVNHVSADESSKATPCIAPAYRQFDFWVGDWDVFEIDSQTKSAHVRVDRVLDGCVLREQYEDSTEHKGESFSIYDASRKVWHQSWVTNRGEMLIIEGALQHDEMVLSGMDHAKSALVRATWKPIKEGVRETAMLSTDQGKTWKLWFDLLFRPTATSEDKRIMPVANDVEKTVAMLDTEYQAAVQKNDVAAMDRLLADNFRLVTGSGKIFSKADLLEEARSGRILYERQDDSEQSVRAWGDTAVVTAKLWAKGTENGKPFEYKLWFSDTYVRTSTGWQYVFGQSSLPLPGTP